ncbi:TrmH family RNA methyltransferase [Candidatus Gottesmanbacteria bacterium]|nr:TrmH family RNA methyltransferase [Candidatus Gottesmanbacteria bacterium]MBI5452829.1 TrmH family RNA methyltransferase [Candidatus Gottesmanbacteria bacterium]
MFRLNAQQLRTQEPSSEEIKKIKRNPIYIILDNVLDTYNVGSIFRLADAVAAKKVFLCGETLTPPNPRIKKASINTWRWVEWQYASTAVEAIAKLKAPFEEAQGRQSSKLKIIAIEQHTKSIPLAKFKPEFPLAIVVGNETYGVSPEVLKMADQIVELPMFGINKSLNVMVTCGIVLYRIVEFL